MVTVRSKDCMVHKDFGRAVYNTLLHAYVSSDLYSIHYSIVVPLMTRGRFQNYFKLFESGCANPAGTRFLRLSSHQLIMHMTLVLEGWETAKSFTRSTQEDEDANHYDWIKCLGGSEICTECPVRSVRSRLCPVSFSPPTGSQSLPFPRLHAKRTAKLRMMEQVVGDLLQVYNTDIMCGSWLHRTGLSSTRKQTGSRH